MTSNDPSRSNSPRYDGKSPEFKSAASVAKDQADGDADDKSELSLVLQVVKKERSTTTVRAVQDKSGHVTYSISKQVRCELDGQVRDSPQLVDRMREDSVVRDYIPGHRAKKKPSEESLQATVRSGLSDKPPTGMATLPSHGKKKADTGGEEKPQDSSSDGGPNQELVTSDVNGPISKEEADKQRRRDKRRRQRERKKEMKEAEEPSLEQASAMFPSSKQTSSDKSSLTTGVNIGSTDMPPSSDVANLVPTHIDNQTGAGANSLLLSPSSGQVAIYTPVKPRSAVIRSPKEDQRSFCATSVNVVFPEEDDIRGKQSDIAGGETQDGESVKKEAPSPGSKSSKGGQSIEVFLTPAVTDSVAPEPKSASSPTSKIFRLPPGLAKMGPIRTPSPPRVAVIEPSSSKELTPKRNEDLSQNGKAISPISTSSSSPSTCSPPSSPTTSLALRLPPELEKMVVISSDIKPVKPQARDRPFETALSSDKPISVNRSTRDLKRVCSRELAQFSQEEINFLVTELYKPDQVASQMAGAEPKIEAPNGMQVRDPAGQAESMAPTKEDPTTAVMVQSSATQLTPTPQTVAAPFENAMLPSQDNQVAKNTSNVALQSGIRTQRSIAFESTGDPEMDAVLLQFKRSEVEDSADLRIKLPLEENAHTLFYRSQVLFFRLMQRQRAKSSTDEELSLLAPKRIETEEQLVGCQQSLMNQQKMFIAEHKASGKPGDPVGPDIFATGPLIGSQVSQVEPDRPTPLGSPFNGKQMMVALLLYIAATLTFLIAAKHF